MLDNEERGKEMWSITVPLAYRQTITTQAQTRKIPPELIYAIIRQESGFREEVISSVGARGLMQVMPATAIAVAKDSGIAHANSIQLFSSQHNISLGVAYLAMLAKRFNYHPVLIAAAYNAGPRQVNYWLKNHSPKQMDIWIETLPWQETRNYLKNVIACLLPR